MCSSDLVAGAWGENAWIELRPDGRVTALLGSMSNGQGHQTAYAQLIADQLGLSIDDIDVVQNGIWLTALLGLDERSLRRSIQRCEDIALAD